MGGINAREGEVGAVPPRHSEETMDQVSIQKLLQDLREELKNIQEAIHALERLIAGMGGRRGRPPLWLTEAKQKKTAQPKLLQGHGSTGEGEEVEAGDDVRDPTN